jgi:GNAT superfamily N-acetyltransferase
LTDHHGVMSTVPRTPPPRRRLRARVERVVEVVEVDLLVWEAEKEPRRPQAQVPLEFRRVDARSLPELRALVPARLYADAERFVGREDRGFAAVTGDGAFAGWVWMSRRPHRDPWSGLTIRLAPDEAYGYALWTPPELRPKGVARALMITMLHEVYADPSLARLYGWVDRRNRESAMLHRLLGFKDVQEVKRARVLNRFGMKVPRSDRPRFGPLSKDGRHRAGLQNRPEKTDTEHR